MASFSVNDREKEVIIPGVSSPRSVASSTNNFRGARPITAVGVFLCDIASSEDPSPYDRRGHTDSTSEIVVTARAVPNVPGENPRSFTDVVQDRSREEKLREPLDP